MMEAFIGQDVDNDADLRVHEVLEKLVDVFKDLFFQF